MVHNVHSQRHQVTDQWYKENLMNKILSKHNRAEEVKRAKDKLVEMGKSKNSTLREIVSSISQKNTVSMKPVTLETH